MASSHRSGDRTSRVAFLVVLCGLLYFFVSACEVRGADAGDDDESGTAVSGGEGAVKQEEKIDPEAFFNQLVTAQSDDDGLTVGGSSQMERFNNVSDDIEKEWKTYAMASAGAAGVGGLGALISHVAKSMLEAPLKDKGESERIELLNDHPGWRKKTVAAGAARAFTGALGGIGLVATIYALTRLLLAKQERRRTQALFEHSKPSRAEWRKGLLDKIKGEANGIPNEEVDDEDNNA